MTINNVEFWKPVIGYEKLYEISSQGRIRSNHKYKWKRGELV